MDSDIIWGNVTFPDIVRTKPLGWAFINPPIINHFRFEAPTEPSILINWISTNYKFAYYIGAIYIVTIFGLQYWMKNRPAYNLRRPLFYWNVFLAAFSTFAFTRTAPSFFYTLGQPNGLYKSICVREGMDIPTAFWSYLFTWSKFVELGDTIFIVLRKRPLVFVQWFHHIVNMGAGWFTTPFLEPVSRWFVVMNLGVHALMYPYFSLRAAGVKIPTLIAKFITTIQFVQMLVGLGVNVVSMYLYVFGYDCYRHPLCIQVWGFLYCSFAILFGKLFYENVFVGKKHKKKD